MKRRTFLHAAPASLGLAALAGRSGAAPASSSGAVRVGVIGVGHRGRDLIRAFVRTGEAKVTALADVDPGRFKIGTWMARQKTANFDDYRRMLDEAEIDAVAIASPLHAHAEQAIAALERGRHVYCEIALAHTIDEARRVAVTSVRTGKMVQVGHQYRYAPWVKEALGRIGKGAIGPPQQIHAFFHRNNDGRHAVEGEEGPHAELANWRLYKKYAGGPLADIGCHQIDLANQIFGTSPESVTACGGVDFWKDGRDVPDHLTAVFRYPGGRTLVFTALSTNCMDGVQARVFGTDGSLVVTNADATLYYEPKTDHSAHAVKATGADATTGATRRGEVPYRGPGEPLVPAEGQPADPDQLAGAAFVECVKGNTRPLADVSAGLASAEWACLANQALAEDRRVFTTKPAG
jgi:predicted dehydrogenase